MKFLVAISVLATIVKGQQSAWAQCGGIGYSGLTTCVTGYSCTVVNSYYSQCQPGSQATTLKSTTTIKPSTTSKSSTSTSKPTSTASAAAVRYLGRVNPATHELTWPGTGISFTFTGTKATIALGTVSGTSSVELTVDGTATVIPAISLPSIAIGPLSSGKHTVILHKRSETNFGTFTITGVTTDGTLSADAAPTRKIEFVGDSITVGYGLDGVNPCTNTAAVEDNPKTYAALAADSLKADYSVVAWSGKGIVRNYAQSTPDTSPLMPEYWTRYGANDADNSYTFPASAVPDAVVINLGTNDFSYLGVRDPLNATTYTNAMVGFVKTVQGHYPSAQFFLMTSPLLSDSYPTAADAQKTTQTNALKAAVAQIGARAHLVDWPTQGADSGCDYHPNAATQAAEAPVLASAIAGVLGW